MIVSYNLNIKKFLLLKREIKIIFKEQIEVVAFKYKKKT